MSRCEVQKEARKDGVVRWIKEVRAAEIGGRLYILLHSKGSENSFRFPDSSYQQKIIFAESPFICEAKIDFRNVQSGKQ